MGKNKTIQSDSESENSDTEQKKNLLDKGENAERTPKPHEKKEFVEPETDETEDQPPYVVVVQGPKKSGKTTLIKSLVKHYTRHKINSVNGTVTVRTGKNARVTFIECPNDINGMIDLAKVADLCLTLVDASVGFEMQTFEFLSILQSHGFPNVMGVLTHLDFFKENKQKRVTTKALKKRFTQEIGDNFKLFYLSGLKYDLYHKNDTHNLARFISIMRFRQPEWKSTHPHILVDRFENTTEGHLKDDDNCKVAFFGYIRGCSYRLNNTVHITGLGDYEIKGMEVIDDPCPVLNKAFADDDKDVDEEGGATGPKRRSSKKRNLKQNERIIYAPQSNLGFLNYEQTSGYITIPDKHVIFTEIEEEKIDENGNRVKEVLNAEGGEGVDMVRTLQKLDKGLDERFDDIEEPELLEGIKLGVDEDEENDEDEEDIVEKRRKEFEEARDRSLAAFGANFDEETNINIDNISKKIYEEDDIVMRGETLPAYDCANYKNRTLHSREHYKALVKSKFVTGGQFSDDEDGEDKEEDEENNIEEDDEEEEEDENAEKKDKKKGKKGEEGQTEEEGKAFVDEERERKYKARSAMKDELLELEYGIYRRGLYVKVEIENVKFKHYKRFTADFPIILCRINPAEDTFGFLKVRIKKHRWYQNILKSNDPLIFSVGWRRYQSVPMYCMEDDSNRLRFLKYTPQHDFCIAVFYGNFAPQNAGVLCTQTIREDVAKFRIAGTGYIMELNHSYEIMKKLKLVGEAFKIFKNTAFIKGMFNSKLEVSKFEGAQIKTVSGIRGQIKKAVKEGPQGSYRATFEDKILMSDIIFLRTWFGVTPEKFYNPLLTYQDIRLMKTTWELRQEQQLSAPVKQDSEYKEITRKKRVFNPLVIPKALESNLPFASRQKLTAKKEKDPLFDALPIKNIKSDHEKQVFALIQRLNTIKNEKKKLEKEKKVEKSTLKAKMDKGEHKEIIEKKKEERKSKYKKQQSIKNKKLKTE